MPESIGAPSLSYPKEITGDRTKRGEMARSASQKLPSAAILCCKTATVISTVVFVFLPLAACLPPLAFVLNNNSTYTERAGQGTVPGWNRLPAD